jgi:hypothetical protein
MAQAPESTSADAERPGKPRWIIAAIAAAGIAFLVLAVVVVGGGIFLAGRAGQTDGTETRQDELVTAPTRPAAPQDEAATEPAAPQEEGVAQPDDAEEPEPPQEDPRILAEAQLSEFYERMEVEDFDGALAAVNRAIDLVPEEAWYFHERAWLLAAMGDLEEALASASEAVALDPENGDHYILRGALSRELADLDRAAGDGGPRILQPGHSPFA